MHSRAYKARAAPRIPARPNALRPTKVLEPEFGVPLALGAEEVPDGADEPVLLLPLAEVVPDGADVSEGEDPVEAPVAALVGALVVAAPVSVAPLLVTVGAAVAGPLMRLVRPARSLVISGARASREDTKPGGNCWRIEEKKAGKAVGLRVKMADSTSEKMDDGIAVTNGRRAVTSGGRFVKISLGIPERGFPCRFSTAAALLVAARVAMTRALICILDKITKV